MCGRPQIQPDAEGIVQGFGVVQKPAPAVVPTLADFAESLSMKFESDSAELSLLAMNPALSGEARAAIQTGAAAAATLARVYAASVEGNPAAGTAAVLQTLHDAIEAGVI
jgi:hypothetical protein